jgi:hypothetical protein
MRSSIPPDSQDAAPMVTVIASRGSALPGSGLAAFARSRSAMTRAPWAFCVGKEGEKLLASPSPDRVLGAQRHFERVPGCSEHGVSGLVAPCVVDAFEVVDVDQQHRET